MGSFSIWSWGGALICIDAYEKCGFVMLGAPVDLVDFGEDFGGRKWIGSSVLTAPS